MLGFINKDVLSVKIIPTAKQNTAQDPKLLSDFCQQMLLEEQPRGQEWRHGASLTPALLFTCPRSHSIDVICFSEPRSVGGGQTSDNREWRVRQAQLPCVISVGFVRWGKGEEHESRKTQRLKSTITHFLSFTTSNVKPILTRPVKTTRSGSITTQGHFVFLITSQLCIFFSTCTSPEKLHWIPNMDLSLFTRMCFAEVLCTLWTVTKPECTVSENKITRGEEC